MLTDEITNRLISETIEMNGDDGSWLALRSTLTTETTDNKLLTRRKIKLNYVSFSYI